MLDNFANLRHASSCASVVKNGKARETKRARDIRARMEVKCGWEVSIDQEKIPGFFRLPVKLVNIL